MFYIVFWNVFRMFTSKLWSEICPVKKSVLALVMWKDIHILGLGKKVEASLNNRLLSVLQKYLDSFKFQDLGEEHKYVLQN